MDEHEAWLPGEPFVEVCNHDMAYTRWIWYIDNESDLKAKAVRLQRCTRCGVYQIYQPSEELWPTQTKFLAKYGPAS